MILNEWKFKTDLHVHTMPVSSCAEIDVPTTVAYYKERGYDGIVITNHFNRLSFPGHKPREEWVEYYLNDYRLAKKTGEKCGLHVCLGMEARFPENANDYLVYGIDEDDVYRAFDYIDGSYEKFYKGFKNEKNVIVQAHPFRDHMELQKLDLLDGIEVYNMHPNHNSRVSIAAKLESEHPGMIITGGTDFHHDGHQGLCAMRTKKLPEDSFEVAEILKSGNYFFDIWGDAVLPHRWQKING